MNIYIIYELLIIDSHIIYEDINYWQSLNIWIIIFMNNHWIYELLLLTVIEYMNYYFYEYIYI